MSETAAQALPAPTAEETAKAAPASGTEPQDTDPTGSGEATRAKPAPVAERSKPEDIESPDEWLKNAETINARILAEAAPKSEEPPVQTEETPAAEVIPPVEAQPAAVTPAPAKPPEDDDEPGKARVRINRANFKSDDDYKVAVKATKLSNEFGLTPAAAETEARRLLGIEAPTAQPAQSSAPAPRADGKPATVEATDAAIAALRTQRREAQTTNLDLEKIADLTDQIEALTEHRRDLRDEQTSAATRQQQAISDQARQSIAQAVEQFPDCAKPDSALTKEMVALDNEWKEDGNPLFHSPNKPLLLAKRASDRLKRNGPATPAAAASPQPVTTPRPVQPAAPVASGAARTTPAAPQQGQLVAKLNGINNPADYEAALAEMTGKRY